MAKLKKLNQFLSFSVCTSFEQTENGKTEKQRSLTGKTETRPIFSFGLPETEKLKHSDRCFSEDFIGASFIYWLGRRPKKLVPCHSSSQDLARPRQILSWDTEQLIPQLTSAKIHFVRKLNWS